MKIKLLYPPLYYPHIEQKPHIIPYRNEPVRIPLISLPILKSYLNNKGFGADQDDLDIKTYMDNITQTKSKKVIMSLFDDRQRIKKFLKTGRDPELEEETEKILKKTEYRGYDAFGFSLTNEQNIAGFGSTLVLAKVIKEKTGAISIVGGSDVLQLLKLFEIKDIIKFIDLIILDHYPHAQSVFIDVLKRLERGDWECYIKKDKKKLSFIDQYGKQRSKVIYKKGVVELEKYDENTVSEEDIFPAPDFEGLPLELYKYSPPNIESNQFPKSKILVLPYYFGYGCPNSCIFCGYSASRHSKFKSPELIVEDLQRISTKNKTRFFIFYNTSVNPTKDFTRRFIKTMQERDLDLLWSDCATIRNMDKKTLEGLYTCGARRLIYGIESPSPQLLKYVNKGITPGKIRKILKLSHEIGIWNEAELICGLPHETDTDIQNTCKFIEQNKEYLNYYHIHKFKLVRSRLTQNPLRYKIRNIRERKDRSVPGKAFDEINGLKWKDKQKQIKMSYDTIFNKILTTPSYGYSDNDKCFLKLIYLYAHLESKKEVLEYIKNNPFTTNSNPIQSSALNKAIRYPKMIFNKITRGLIAP